jgi:antiviral helicase SKI2
MLNSTLVQKQFAEEEFVNVYSSWISSAWDELEWSKVNELHVRELLAERKAASDLFEKGKCLSCPDFLKHYGMQHDEWLIKENIQSLKLLMSDQNLALLPDYQQRTEVLKDLDFVDSESRVQLKGKVACEIHSADELVLTELILENVLAEFVRPGERI